MLIKDIFSEVFIGVNLNNYTNDNDLQEVYTFKKNNIIYSSILYNDFGYNKFNKTPYKFIPNNELNKIKVSKRIKEKYFISFNDIVISLKKPYKVFTDIISKNDKILVNNNYVILRGINTDKYYVPYLVYYIDNVGIEEYLNNFNKINSELSLEDIKNIKIPTIPKKEQMNKYFEVRSLIRNIIDSQEQINEILKNNQN